MIEPAFSEAEKLALAGFLAGYSGLTREAYTLDLRQFTAWCRQRQLRLFAVRRADIELFPRDLEAAGRARAARPGPARSVCRRACPRWVGQPADPDVLSRRLLGRVDFSRRTRLAAYAAAPPQVRQPRPVMLL